MAEDKGTGSSTGGGTRSSTRSSTGIETAPDAGSRVEQLRAERDRLKQEVADANEEQQLEREIAQLRGQVDKVRQAREVRQF